jgi:hypothetical protein
MTVESGKVLYYILNSAAALNFLIAILCARKFYIQEEKEDILAK